MDANALPKLFKEIVPPQNGHEHIGEHVVIDTGSGKLGIFLSQAKEQIQVDIFIVGGLFWIGPNFVLIGFRFAITQRQRLNVAKLAAHEAFPGIEQPNENGRG